MRIEVSVKKYIHILEERKNVLSEQLRILDEESQHLHLQYKEELINAVQQNNNELIVFFKHTNRLVDVFQSLQQKEYDRKGFFDKIPLFFKKSNELVYAPCDDDSVSGYTNKMEEFASRAFKRLDKLSQINIDEMQLYTIRQFYYDLRPFLPADLMNGYECGIIAERFKPATQLDRKICVLREEIEPLVAEREAIEGTLNKIREFDLPPHSVIKLDTCKDVCAI